MTNIPRWVHEGGLLAVIAGVALHSAPARAKGCVVSACGSNTPVLFGTPIIGLSKNGDVNGEGVALAPTLERVGRPIVPDCPLGAQLGVHNGGLVGMEHGTIVCGGASMIGLAFWIIVPIQPCSASGTPQPSDAGARQPGASMRQPAPSAKPCKPDATARVQVRIDASASVSTWEVQNPSNVRTYRLVLHKLDKSAALPVKMRTEFEGLVGKSICPRKEAWMEPWQDVKPDGFPSDTRPDTPPLLTRIKSWRQQTDHLQIVQGETYAPDGSIDRGRVGQKWFNFACVGTAIAKMRLLGYDPMAENPLPTTAAPLTTAQRARQATLKMLTARYYGDVSYTRPGMPLRWVRRDHTKFYGTPEESKPIVIESYWNEWGAMCLSHRRTWRSPSKPGQSFVLLAEALPEVSSFWGLLPYFPWGFPQSEAVSINSIQRPTGLPACDAPPAAYVWATYPVDHVAH